MRLQPTNTQQKTGDNMLIELLDKSSDTVGLIGVILLLIAYYLLSVNKMSAMSYSYQILNLLGAVFILFSLMFHWNLSSTVIEVAWIIISFIGIYRISKEQNTKPSNLYVLKQDENKCSTDCSTH